VSTYGATAALQIRAICESLGLESYTADIQTLFARLTRGWADHPIDRGPFWRSDLTDDHTPYEFSVAFRHDRSEVRMLVEAQTPAGSARDQWLAGLRLQDELASTLDLHRERFDAIRPLFAPAADCRARFTLWHSVVFDPGGKHLIKVYLNPAVGGDSALLALGYGHAIASIERFTDDHQHPCYLSLDLTDTGARVKVYLAQSARTAAAYVEHLGRISPEAAEDASGLLERFIASNQEIGRRPLLTCLGFRQESSVPEVTTHFPVRCYVDSDQQSLDAIGEGLSRRVLQQLRELVPRIARAPLSASRGRVSYISCGRSASGLRHTIYLAPCCHTAPHAVAG
jgi:DMATS type aromatic prenyltransferase